ncbi:hypothetical protein BFU36_01630 [Sulfolobus sp. A20]|uniref:hypothetical protein n=1 Tax=Sulfolobaceae TaxID=118883 RepID=UPI000845FDDE|nr:MULTISPECIES: hypothetical protein [unclassified Sulfolobus]TRM73495.1 hypothetical protein DJ528_11635 [Sulfolobus sp. B5]TRM78159.1 hypothetical protein DJ532_02040 [Sulfolobus sp. A20-N-F8]TRM84153.1 hypothetical protein DJ531_01930 [Sulfolobus sp. A20-N-F6]TRM88647.1 hypothetical protein DJ529_04505 [Sulfolobus sp. C3]TRM97638.1 hypothetical protein DJ527_11785 [Sulfolobus sp. F1]
MTYVDENSRICRPNEVKNIAKGDIIVTQPATLNIDGRILTFPPLSLISEKCKHIIRTLTWVEGIRIDDELINKVIYLDPKEDIEFNDIEILEPQVASAYTLKSLLGQKLRKAKIIKAEGVPIINVNKIPIVGIRNGLVYIGIRLLGDEDILFRLFGYSLLYYMSSSSSD